MAEAASIENPDVSVPLENAEVPNPDSAARPEPQSLEALITAANLQYSLKKYTAAADIYSSAVEVQAEQNGELHPENGDLLYLYGRCLYHVAVAKSDVLGGKVAAEEKSKKKTQSKAGKADASSSADAVADAIDDTAGGDSALKSKDEKLAEEVMEAAVEEKEGAKKEEEEETVENKPYFQITGDENFDTSGDEDEEAEAEAEEEEDEFANAYEILDLARVLLSRKLEQLEQTPGADSNGDATAVDSTAKGKGKATADATDASSPVYKLKERLADAHDLQAEISLENERFADAIPDSRAALALKLALYPPESELVAEAHFKLSLALEFASMEAVRQFQRDQEAGVAATAASGAGTAQEKPEVDEEMRAEAAAEMEGAIESCRLRVTKEEAGLPAAVDDAARRKKEAGIANVKEILADMEQRLVELRQPALRAPTAAGGPADTTPLQGLLGSILGETPAQQRKRIEEASKGATDLTNLVRHRKKDKPEAGAAAAGGEKAVNGNGKRRLEEDEAGGRPGDKRARVEDA